MAADSVLDGVFAINKPYGMSSAQVIRDCKTYFNPSKVFQPMLESEKAARAKESNFQQKRRRRVKQAVEVKMGHGGTLDPMATGVLILGCGKGTKALSSFLGCTKTYETVVVFGASSDSYDRCGKLLKNRAYDHITKEKVLEAMEAFKGTYQQMPPLFSALKMDGKPLYEYAREGKPIPREIQTREVTVTDMEMLEYYEPGTHTHYWPTAEATAAEKLCAEQLWRVEKEQASGKKMTPEEEEADNQAVAEHEDLKRKFEEKQDELVQDRQSKKQKKNSDNDGDKQPQTNGAQPPTSPVMSGALGELPPKGRGSDLVEPVAVGAPAPWEGKGPPAVKVRMTATSGFYVRSFAHDLGEKLDSAGLMTELVRSRQGDFVLGGPNCLEYDDLAKGEDVWGPQVEGMLRRPKRESSPKREASPTKEASPKREATPTRRSPSPKREGSPKAEAAA
ncbi:hypothetical protein VMCG_05652 [Cytospora schulzeri]|uniref:tRNA pseudouridine(55) synthase n=1 Tax=Cytospora schulzeri TaxID=448051 RepID=A0A423WFE5_9PEZI|nr:hypothetical protein VMCG_05652 [Valsa malicola]